MIIYYTIKSSILLYEYQYKVLRLDDYFRDENLITRRTRKSITPMARKIPAPICRRTFSWVSGKKRRITPKARGKRPERASTSCAVRFGRFSPTSSTVAVCRNRL